MKTHVEGNAESLGNYMDIHGVKRRAIMDIESLGREAFIHWNDPPLLLVDNLGRMAQDRYFNYNSWNFITHLNRSESTVIKRMKTVESRYHSFEPCYMNKQCGSNA